MKASFLFVICLCPLLTHAATDDCSATLLESKTVYTAAIGLIERNLAYKVTLMLRGRYDSMSKPDESALQRSLINKTKPLNAPAVVEKISHKRESAEVEIRITGIGKAVLRTLLDLNTKPTLTRAKSWTAWSIETPDTIAMHQPLPPPEPISLAQMQERLLMPLKSIEFSVRTKNAMKNNNLHFLGDLVSSHQAELLRLPNFGRRSLREVEEVLHGLGFTLGMNIAEWPPREPIHPVRYQVAVEPWPEFAISEWSSVALEEALEYVQIMQSSRTSFLMTNEQKNAVVLMPLQDLTEGSVEHVVWTIKSEEREIVDHTWIRRLRDNMPQAKTIELEKTLGPAGQKLFTQIAEADVPLRIRVRPGKADYLVLIPLSEVSR